MAGAQENPGISTPLSEAKNGELVSHDILRVPFPSSSLEQERDGIHDALEFPTEKEKLELRRVADTIPWNAYCSSSISATREALTFLFTAVIALIELAERFSVSLAGFPLEPTFVTDKTSSMVARLSL